MTFTEPDRGVARHSADVSPVALSSGRSAAADVFGRRSKSLAYDERATARW
jgi:hypothetical protein